MVIKIYKENHPGKNDETVEKKQTISHAYQILKNPISKKIFDLDLTIAKCMSTLRRAQIKEDYSGFNPITRRGLDQR